MLSTLLRLSVAPIVWIVLLVSVAPAAADPMVEAKKLFDRANEQYNLGEFADAIVNYKEAYRLTRRSALIFNIAQCQRKLGHYSEAINLYNNYLVEQPDAPNREVVEDLIRESTTALEAQQRSEQAARETQLNSEAHRAAAERTRMETERLAAQAAQAEREQRTRDQAEQRQRAEAERLALEKERASYDRHPNRKWAYVGAALGVVALGTGGYFGVTARRAQTKFDEGKCGDPTAPLVAVELAACLRYRDDGNRASLLANVMLGSGAALSVAAVVVFLVDPGNVSPKPPGRVQVGLGPGSVTFALSF